MTGAFFCCQEVGKIMQNQSSGGNIINIASTYGLVGPNQNIYKPDKYGYKGVNFNTPSFYSVGKAGVIHLTKYLATYWAKNNVRVNSISPAGVFKYIEIMKFPL